MENNDKTQVFQQGAFAPGAIQIQAGANVVIGGKQEITQHFYNGSKTANKASTEQPAPNKPTENQASEDQPTADNPTADAPTADEPDTPAPPRRKGRPRAEDRPLTDYLMPDVDEQALIADWRARIQGTLGTASDHVLVQQALIEEGKLKQRVPYKILKRMLGEKYVSCRESFYNKSWRGQGNS